MRPRRCEDGFTLIEMIVVTAIVVIVAGMLGTFFLAGATPAVAAAGRDVTAAFDEARRTAVAFDAATVVFAPAQSGTGYSARVYASVPGTAGFQARNGPTYDSTVTISESAAPLGAPGFAFALDSHGGVTGYAGFVATATTFDTHPCPAGGAFTLQLTYERDVRIVTIPCRLGVSSATPVAFETPVAAFTATPFPVQTCPSSVTCSLAQVAPAVPPSVPPASTPTAQPNPSAVLPASPPAAPAPTSAVPAGMIEEYVANADYIALHIATLFSDGSVCDDEICPDPSAAGWACPNDQLQTSYGGSNGPYQQTDGNFDSAVITVVEEADRDVSGGGGDGLVTITDTYCVGFPDPDPS
jgi:prepilin-type N-terminal cleavage/methylation domain-containing protein